MHFDTETKNTRVSKRGARRVAEGCSVSLWFLRDEAEFLLPHAGG